MRRCCGERSWDEVVDPCRHHDLCLIRDARPPGRRRVSGPGLRSKPVCEHHVHPLDGCCWPQSGQDRRGPAGPSRARTRHRPGVATAPPLGIHGTSSCGGVVSCQAAALFIEVSADTPAINPVRRTPPRTPPPTGPRRTAPTTSCSFWLSGRSRSGSSLGLDDQSETTSVGHVGAGVSLTLTRKPTRFLEIRHDNEGLLRVRRPELERQPHACVRLAYPRRSLRLLAAHNGLGTVGTARPIKRWEPSEDTVNGLGSGLVA